MSAGDKDRTSFHRVGGSLSQARSRESTKKHEHCVANMLAQSSMIKCLRQSCLRGRAGTSAPRSGNDLNNNAELRNQKQFQSAFISLISISCVAKLKICPIYPRNMFTLYRPGIAADGSELRNVGRMKTPSRETAAKFEDARAAEAAKTARLRALRLAKEAADRDAEQSAAATRASLKLSPRARGSNPPGRNKAAV